MFRKVLLGLPRCNRSCRYISTELSYLHHIGSKPLRHSTVGTALEEAANAWPLREAVVDCYTKHRYTFASLLEQADKLAAALRERGLEYGDKVGIWAPNTAEWLVAYVAAARAGLVSVAINPLFTKSEVEYCLKKVEVKALIISEDHAQQKYYKILVEIIKELPMSKPGEIKCDTLEKLKTVIVLGSKALPGTFSYNELIESSTASQVDAIQRQALNINPDSACNIQFTSGTTGNPKAAVLSHQGIVNNAYFSGIRYEMDIIHQKICVQVPLFHVFGVLVMAMSSFQHGATMVLASPFYSPTANLKAHFEEKCTAVVGTPTMFVDLISKMEGVHEKSRVNWALTGGASCTPFLMQSMKEKLGAQSVKSIFGMTEMSGGMFESLPGESEEKSFHTVGHLLDHLEAKVVDENDCIVPIGSPGELYVRGYSSLMEYFKDPEKTNETLGKDGWLRTGDQVVLASDGYAKIVGRLKDLIIRGGENIYPKEIEDFIDQHPAVIESQVFGVEDYRLGEEICVALRLQKGATLDVNDIKSFCRGTLMPYKIPRFVRLVDDFPRTTSGKVKKRDLVTMFQEGKL